MSAAEVGLKGLAPLYSNSPTVWQVCGGGVVVVGWWWWWGSLDNINTTELLTVQPSSLYGIQSNIFYKP